MSPRILPILFLAALGSCRSVPTEPVAPRPDPGALRRERAPAEIWTGDQIVVCGRRFAVDAPVVLWFEEPRYDAYRRTPRFASTGGEAGQPGELRYRPGRAVSDPALRQRVATEGWSLEALRGVVDQLVLHYDVCGTSRACFRVLHDQRNLSVHFLLDVDGTIYQTLDLQEQAWHARQANPRSIGIEIAQIGAYPPEQEEPLASWYRTSPQGTRLVLPEGAREHLRRPDFSSRPARSERIEGEIQGARWAQFDFTPEQYASLVALTRTLLEAFPNLRADAPRATDGSVRTDVLTDEEFAAFSGILGHYHVSRDKRDPGPAFDWEPFLAAVRAQD